VKFKEHYRALVAAQEQRLRAQGYKPRPAVKKVPAAIDARRAYAVRTTALQEHLQSGGMAALMAFGATWPVRARMLGNPRLMAQLLARRPA
jgi:hypothetical protein